MEKKLIEIKNAINFWSDHCSKIGLMFYFWPSYPESFFSELSRLGINKIVCTHEDKPASKIIKGVEIVGLDVIAVDFVNDIDIFIIGDDFYDAVYHSIGVNAKLNNFFRERDIPIVPLSDTQVLRGDKTIRGIERLSGAGDVIAQYLQRSNLSGGYAEFGTWFGCSFFNNLLSYGDQLKGGRYAFDSFGGLPRTSEGEAEFTNGDWVQGRYWCNKASFLGNAKLCGVDQTRIDIVEGFYNDTLDGKSISDYGISQKSLSFVCIDCDVYESTLSVLRFVEPALDDGAVIYFDDWLLARAAPNVSEYHAAQVWIKESMNTLELIPLYRGYWASQYFIFNRRWTTGEL